MNERTGLTAQMDAYKTQPERTMLLKMVQDLSITMLTTASVAMATRNPQAGACYTSLAGGCAAFGGSDVPLTRAIGIGTAGAIDSSEISLVEAFYDSRKAPINIAISDRTHERVPALLHARGYEAGGFMDNWWMPLLSAPNRNVSSEIEISPASIAEADLWARNVAAGFEEEDCAIDEAQLSPRIVDTFYCLGFGDGAKPFFARLNGEVVGGGVLFVNGGAAHIRTAACRYRYRHQGVQTALLSARLEAAFNAGCRLAFSSTTRTGMCVRNLERFGFKRLSVSYMMSVKILNQADGRCEQVRCKSSGGSATDRANLDAHASQLL